MREFLLFLMMTISAIAKTNPPEHIIRILNSGNGKSHQTAFEVSTIEEEYQLLQYLQLKPSIQMVVLKEGQYFDVLQVGENQVWFKLIPKVKYNAVNFFS